MTVRRLGRFVLPLALVMLAGWRMAEIWADLSPPPSDPLRKPAELILGPDPTQTASIPWTRPLFSKPRKVAVAAEQETQSHEPNSALPPRLLGVIAEAGSGIAILESNGHLVRARSGGAVGPWRIVEIESRLVTIQNGGDTRVLNLDPR